jgi:hypothetical protein
VALGHMLPLSLSVMAAGLSSTTDLPALPCRVKAAKRHD